MTRRRTVVLAAAAAAVITASGLFLASPPSAHAFNPIKPICAVAGLVNGVAQKACSVVSQVAGGAASTATTALTVAAVVTWAVGGAKFLLHETSHVLAKTTAPQLTSTWFSSTYWRVAEIAAVLTLPFLFAAAVQALLRSDLSLLIRAALGYLPLALLAVAIAAPLTMLLLAASDQLSAIVSSAAGNQSAHFLDRSAGLMGSISASVSSSFVGFLVALFTAAGAIVLWMELLVREAAVYVIVLMLPLAFAAFVWPARRIWAIRSIELLVALVLSKFAVVAVLSLGGAALTASADRSVTGLLAGAVLVSLAAFAPWAMLRVVPLTEIASGAAASLGGGARAAFHGLQRSDAWASEGDHWASKTAQMRRAADTSGEARSADRAAGGTDGAISVKESVDANLGADARAANSGPDAGPPPRDPAMSTDDRGSVAYQADGASASGNGTASESDVSQSLAGPADAGQRRARNDRRVPNDESPPLDLDKVATPAVEGAPRLHNDDPGRPPAQGVQTADVAEPTPSPQPADRTPPSQPPTEA